MAKENIPQVEEVRELEAEERQDLILEQNERTSQVLANENGSQNVRPELNRGQVGTGIGISTYLPISLPYQQEGRAGRTNPGIIIEVPNLESFQEATRTLNERR